jgi:hypothetical protein
MKASTFPRRSLLVFATAIAVGLIACAEEKAPELIIGTATGANNAPTFGLRCLKNGGGEGQQGVVRERLADSLCIRVVTATGFPVGGVRVLWSSSAPAAGMEPTTSTTNELTGETKSRWRLGRNAGLQNASASADGTPNPVMFTATGTAGDASRMIILDGDAQTGVVGRALPKQLLIQIYDANDNPVTGAEITFLARGDSGRVTTTGSDTVALSDAEGRVTATWTLGVAKPLQGVRAQLPGGDTNIRFTATATDAFSMQPVGALRYAVREFRRSVGHGQVGLR